MSDHLLFICSLRLRGPALSPPSTEISIPQPPNLISLSLFPPPRSHPTRLKTNQSKACRAAPGKPGRSDEQPFIKKIAKLKLHFSIQFGHLFIYFFQKGSRGKGRGRGRGSEQDGAGEETRQQFNALFKPSQLEVVVVVAKGQLWLHVSHLASPQMEQACPFGTQPRCRCMNN